MKKRKKGVSLFLAICMLFCAAAAPASAASYKISFTSKSDAVYFVNYDTQTVMYEQNAQKQTNPGALTAVMTAMVTLEYCEKNSIPLETEVTAQSYLFDEFAGLGVTTADVRSGETVRIIDLLYALMLQSACEAANILADYVGGGLISTFIDMMNAKAKQLGAEHTVFTNPHGLHDPNQVTTAYDQYLIVNAAMQNETFAEIATTVSYKMPATNKHASERYVVHSNYMLSPVRGGSYYYKYAKGIKTGAAGDGTRSMISMAEQDGYRYLLITMGAPTKTDTYEDALAFFKWGFSSFSLQNILKAGDIAGEVKVSLSAQQDYVLVTAAEDVSAVLPKETDATAVQQVPKLVKNVRAPVTKGEVLGRMDFKLADEVIASVDLIAAEDVERSTLLYAGDVTLRFFSQPLALIGLILLILLLIVLFAWIRQIQKNRQRRAERIRRVGR
ncbi:MAG: D-alanyl-D-alanine carboxypeptidase family protein [Oscillospiraceae bacterium]|nr:D-alanyl-D-alanine carboxypeptidase [Oscillospiraceae bacterium]MDY3066142.1 D-alanyl-D-alanine carboxypeptidase family protein [Oscillospiraceae bacterium]